MKKTILSLIILLGACFTASAQKAEQTQEVFNPHWFVGVQFGAQETVGEIKFGNLISPNAQIYGGYQFTDLWALRLAIGGWQSKGGVDYADKSFSYKWNYIAPAADVLFNLTNAIGGYKPHRLVDVNLLAGIGANFAFNNSDAGDTRSLLLESTGVDFLRNYWENSSSVVGRFGGAVDFNVSKRVALGIEVNANLLSDRYNSKQSSKGDWYINALAGVKIKLGKNTKTVPVVVPVPMTRIDTVYVTKEKTVTVHDTVTVPEPLRRDIFFSIASYKIVKAEMSKVEDIVAYLKRWNKAKVYVTGYADKGTGSAKINAEYARKRAEAVANLLSDQFGISKDRIVVDSKGDTVQTYEKNELNRASICIAE